MVNVILILTSVAFAVLVLISSLYFLVHFQDPSDKWEAWFPKIVVVLGVSIACYNVLLLPLNVANQSGEIQANGGLPMNVFNLVFFIATIVFVLLVVPFTIFYYEGYDGAEKGEKSKSQLWNAIVWTVPTIIIFVCILVPLYITAGYAEIPVAQLSGTFVSTTNPLDSYCSNNLSVTLSNPSVPRLMLKKKLKFHLLFTPLRSRRFWDGFSSQSLEESVCLPSPSK